MMTPPALTKVRIITTSIYVFLTLPIWYFLLYQILKRVEATELMMFLFWIYVPTAILGAILTRILETSDS